SENGLASSEYVIRTRMEEAKLVSAKLEVEKTAIIADDVIDLKVSGLLENGDEVDLTGTNPTFAFDPTMVRIENGKLYALREGEVRVTATATYKGSTVTSPEMLITIAKNTAEKVIESLEPVTVIVDRGIAPVLPETVVAHFKTGLPQNVNVTWGNIAPSQYAKLGEFAVLGSVAGTNIKAKAKVIVKGAVAVEQVSKAVLRSQKPNLPETLTVYFSDGTSEQMAVVWADILPGSLDSV